MERCVVVILLLALLVAAGTAEERDIGDDDLFGPEPAAAAEARSEAVWLVRDEPGGKLAPDERGLALLRSPELADRPLRVIGVVGQARTGKSFFMNSLVGSARTFEVSSGDEGFTKGLWLHHLDGAAPTAPTGDSNDGRGAGDSGPAAAEDVATILIDSEGLGAPGGSKVYDTKMVALTYMLSSVTFYNNMRKVNKMDIEFLGDVVLFDEVFRSISQQPLLASSIVWLVQSYSSKDECRDYPARFLRKLGAEADEELVMHDRVIDYVESRSSRDAIFCLPYPKTQPYVAEADLHMLDLEQLDDEYRDQMAGVREFIASVPPKHGVQSGVMTGRELAWVLERIVPSLNDMESTAKSLVGMRAEAARHNASMLAGSLLEAAEAAADDCRELAATDGDMRSKSLDARSQALLLFNASLIGHGGMAENQRELSRLEETLHWMSEAAEARFRSKAAACRPDSVLVIFRDYYLLLYGLQVDVAVRTMVGHTLGMQWISRALIMVLSWPREVAIASGILNMLPPRVVCQQVADMGWGVLDVSPADCSRSIAFAADSLRWLVEVWIAHVTPICQEAVTLLHTLLASNSVGAGMLASMAVGVRIAPMEVVAKVLPSMALILALLALSPLPSNHCHETDTCPQGLPAPGVQGVGGEAHAEEPSGGGSPLRDSAAVYRAVLTLLLVWSLVDLARAALRAVRHGVKMGAWPVATRPAPPCPAAEVRERESQKSGTGSNVMLEGSARVWPSGVAGASGAQGQPGAEGGGRIEEWLHAQHGSGRAGALSTVTPEPREEASRAESDESVLHAAGNGSLLAHSLAHKTVRPRPPLVPPLPLRMVQGAAAHTELDTRGLTYITPTVRFSVGLNRCRRVRAKCGGGRRKRTWAASCGRILTSCTPSSLQPAAKSPCFLRSSPASSQGAWCWDALCASRPRCESCPCVIPVCRTRDA